MHLSNSNQASAHRFRIEPWEDKARKTSPPKRLLNFNRRQINQLRAARAMGWRSPLPFDADGLALSSGYHREHRIHRAWPGRSLSGKSIVVQGTGTGWDVVAWARMRPRTIVAVDLYPFDCWPDVRRHCLDSFGVEVSFHASSLERLDFLPDESVDLCVSDAVLEHCKNLPAVVSECNRVLKPGGATYATYGPLWYAAGGDHFSGRGGLTNAFAHVELSPENYDRYFKSHLLELEDFQSGGRYVELDLFSKLTTKQYLEVFESVGFKREWLILEISSDALAFRTAFPDRMAELVRSNKVEEWDFFIKGNYVRFRKPNA